MKFRIYTRQEMQEAIENRRTFDGIRDLYEADLATDCFEIGGEVYMSGRQSSPYLSTRSKSLVFKNIAHKYNWLADYITEMRRGKYVERHFKKMLKMAKEWASEESFDRENWSNIIERMKKLLEKKHSNDIEIDASPLGERGELFSVSNYYRWILSGGYYKPERVKSSHLGSYIGDFHIHSNLETPSNYDKDAAKNIPELVIIYKKSHLTNVKFVYLFPKKQNKNKRVRVGQFKFGPYKI